MNLSRSSKSGADPLSQVLASLGTHSIRRAWLEAGGNWALSFPAVDRLRFMAVLRGTCWFCPTNLPPQQLSAGDVVLVGQTGYVVASDPEALAKHGLSLPVIEDDRLCLGGDDVLALGGGVAFTPGTSRFLFDMLPSSLVVRSSSGTASAISNLLSLLDREAREAGLGSDAVVARLAELLIVEAIRFHAENAGSAQTGWLGALVDPRIGRALHMFHVDIARPWTVALLANEAAMSRASFSASFNRLVGRPPIEYIRAWRMTLASARLAAGASVALTATDVGYASQSAFAVAYRRFFGSFPSNKKGSVPNPVASTTLKAAPD